MFEPDCRHLVEAARNRRPARLPLYEHIIAPEIMEQVLDVPFRPLGDGRDPADLREYFTHVCRFFRQMTYDTVSYEGGVLTVMPDSGAIMGGRDGPIQTRRDFETYPWDQIALRYWERFAPRFDALTAVMPPGMQIVGGVGYGVFEISEDLVGYERLCYLQADDPPLFADLYVRIGDLLVGLWDQLLRRYGRHLAVCRMGDDLGFKTSTLLAPPTIVQHVLPQYARIIGRVHAAGKPFLLHSCGRIFDVMDAIIDCGIDAKHSNEDAVAPFDQWIEQYSGRIGLFGGVDVDLLCQRPPDEIFERVVEMASRFRRSAAGYALGSGNSIPDYVPVDGYLAMVRAAQEIRRLEAQCQ